MGDGTRVKFWDDVWCRDRPLMEAFIDLYNISRTRDASVLEVMCFVNGRVSWDIQFRRLVNDQESGMMCGVGIVLLRRRFQIYII